MLAVSLSARRRSHADLSPLSTSNQGRSSISSILPGTDGTFACMDAGMQIFTNEFFKAKIDNKKKKRQQTHTHGSGTSDDTTVVWWWRFGARESHTEFTFMITNLGSGFPGANVLSERFSALFLGALSWGGAASSRVACQHLGLSLSLAPWCPANALHSLPRPLPLKALHYLTDSKRANRLSPQLWKARSFLYLAFNEQKE